MQKAWLKGVCRKCGFPVVVTDASNFLEDSKKDYFWYCANKVCRNSFGESAFDTEEPSWVNITKLTWQEDH